MDEYLRKSGLAFVSLALGWVNVNFVIKSDRLVVEKESGDLVYTVPHGKLEGAVYDLVSITHDLGRIVALIAKNFDDANLNGRTITISEKVYSNQDILDVFQKVTGRKARLVSLDSSYQKAAVRIPCRLRAKGPFPTPELIPDPILTKLGFKFQTLEEYTKDVIVLFLGL